MRANRWLAWLRRVGAAGLFGSRAAPRALAMLFVVSVFRAGLEPLPAARADGDLPLHARVDAAFEKLWQREKITPAPLADDAEFLRRVYLDLIGVIPTHTEAKAFLADSSADKRVQLIDRLLADPRHARHMADLWDLVLFTRNPPGYDTDKRDGLQEWLRARFAENTPYNEIARGLLKGEGNSAEHGPPMYLLQYRNRPEDAAEHVTQTFLGVQLQCARCHDHPYEDWKQVDFYGVAAFLARINFVSLGKHKEQTKYVLAEKSSGDLLFAGPAQQQQPGKKGDPVPPKFLQGPVLEQPPLPADFKEVTFKDNEAPKKPLFSRKDQFADWVAAPQNPFLARAAVNRAWAWFFGRGLVHPVDNMSPSNKPLDPELLQELADAFTEKNFDLRWLTRELCLTRLYQLSSRGGVNDPLPQYHQQARSRPLSAEELVDSWREANDWSAVEKNQTKPSSEGRFHPLTRDYVIRYFGQPTNGVGDFQGGLQEHLYLNNGQLGQLTQGKGGLYDTLANSKEPPEAKVERLYYSILSRPPTAEETRRFVEHLSASDQKEERLKEAIWVLMTCAEFRFNH